MAYCNANGIAVTGYCPLARCKNFGATPLAAVAEAVGQPEASVAIRWSLQSGVITIPKSSKPERIASNAAVVSAFELSDEQMAAIATPEVNTGFTASSSQATMFLPWVEVK